MTETISTNSNGSVGTDSQPLVVLKNGPDSPSIQLVTPNVVKAVPSKWLADGTISAVHDAFLLGWKLFELKSRIQIEVFNHVVRVKTPQTANNLNIEDAMNGAADLIKILLPQVRPYNQEQEARTLLTNAKDSLFKASEWRSIFTQIATLHNNRFPQSNLSNSYFDLLKNKTPQELLPYLFPQNANAGSDDFADVGISKVDSQNLPLLPQFAVFEITRRLLNCLNLLYIKPGESLLPSSIVKYQGELLKIVNVVKPLALTANPTRLNLTMVAGTNIANQTLKICQEGTGNLDWQATSSVDWLSLSASNGSLDNTNNAAIITLTVDTSKLTAGSTYTAQINLSANEQSITVPVNVLYVDQAQANDAINAVELTDEANYDAICLLSGLAVRFLENWDNYLREHYYTGGSINNDETELMAYEAGRTLAELSWGISVSLAKLESERQIAVLEKSSTDIKDSLDYYQKLYAAWANVFNKRKIVQAQHQISALSTALNDSYYRISGKTPPQQQNQLNVALDPDLPGTAIHSIKHSLDFWQRAIEWFKSDNGKNWMQYEMSRQLGPNAVTVVAPAFPENISHRLQVGLIQQADTWQAILTFQQSLRDFSNESITQKIINDFMNDFEQAVAKEIKNDGKKIAKAAAPAIWVIVAVVAVIIVAGAVLLWSLGVFNANSSNGSLIGLIVAGITAGGSAYVVKSTGQPTASNQSGSGPTESSNTSDSPSQGGFGRVRGLFVATESSIADTFRRGYEQVQTEFASLNYHVSVAFPLVEFFVLNITEEATAAMAKATQAKVATVTQPQTATAKITSQQTTNQLKAATHFSMNSAYDFLTKIIWSEEERQEEIQRVTRVAFGPIGGFVGAFNASESNTSEENPS